MELTGTPGETRAEPELLAIPATRGVQSKKRIKQAKKQARRKNWWSRRRNVRGKFVAERALAENEGSRFACCVAGAPDYAQMRVRLSE